jgi:hypothetical protein
MEFLPNVDEIKINCSLKKKRLATGFWQLANSVQYLEAGINWELATSQPPVASRQPLILKGQKTLDS